MKHLPPRQRALQEELEQEREACSGARCSIEKLQSKLLACTGPNISRLCVKDAGHKYYMYYSAAPAEK